MINPNFVLSSDRHGAETRIDANALGGTASARWRTIEAQGVSSDQKDAAQHKPYS
jgi:hypothetical protein